eukprot:Hpha_TRINITY_DN10241_c0_g1::TRINITY_DN10241_c0_g1_i1::g.35159::m.35159
MVSTGRVEWPSRRGNPEESLSPSLAPVVEPTSKKKEEEKLQLRPKNIVCLYFPSMRPPSVSMSVVRFLPYLIAILVFVSEQLERERDWARENAYLFFGFESQQRRGPVSSRDSAKQ